MRDPSNIAELGPLATLRQYVRRERPAERQLCELCSGAISPDHQHLLELGKRSVRCACDACAVLFSSHEAPRYRRIPRRVRMLRDFALEDQQWESLLIPINLAFFFYNSAAGRVLAYYPSPAGATESLLDLEHWDAIAERNPVLKRMEPDVEALLVNRVSNPHAYFIAPIDHCYRLVGVIRKNWRGLSGGKEVWKQIDSFFAAMRSVRTAADPAAVRGGDSPARAPARVLRPSPTVASASKDDHRA